MKKNLLILVLAAAIAACQHPKPEGQAEAFSPVVAQEKGTVFEAYRVKDANQSQIDFNNAITALERSDYPAAARHIRDGVNALVNEGKWLRGERQQHIQTAVKNLETLATEVEKGEVRDPGELEHQFALAELDVAHELVVGLGEYEVETGLPDSYYPHFKAAIQALGRTEKRLHGPALQEARQLVADSEALIRKVDAGATNLDPEIRRKRQQIEDFLKKHRPEVATLYSMEK